MDSTYSQLVDTIKQIALESVGATEPLEVIIGEVVGVDPLEIKIDPKIILQEGNIVLTKNTSEWTME
jgi:hypothetical protein